MMKIVGCGAGSISQRHGSAGPDPYQNVSDPQHCFDEDPDSDQSEKKIRIHITQYCFGSAILNPRNVFYTSKFSYLVLAMLRRV
jgi:hypothetical protein